MSPRRFFLLIAAAIVVLVLALSVARLRHGEVAGAGEPVLPQLATQFGDVTRVTLRHGAAAPQVTLQRQAGGWTLDQRDGYPADSAKLRRLLVALAELRVAEEKTADPANYATLGVDDPGPPGASGTEVTITTGTTSRSLIIGKPAAGGNFVRDPHAARSVLAIPGTTPDGEPRDWIDPQLLDIRPAGIREVSIAPPHGQAVKRAGSDWAGLAGLDIADVAAATGIDWKDATVTTVTLADGSTLVLTGTVAGDRHWLAVTATADTALAAKTRGRAFELGTARYDAIFRP
jgi:hypothetical protein